MAKDDANAPAKKPYLHGATTAHIDPYAVSAPNMYFVWPMMMLVMVSGSKTSPYFAFLMAFAVMLILFIHRPWQRNAAVRALHRVSSKLSWFDYAPATCRPLPPEPELNEQLAEHGYDAVTIDGGEIASWSELVDALTGVIEPHSWQQDPRKRAMDMLARMASEQGRPRAIVWRNATATNQRNPSLIPNVVADWSALAPHHKIGQVLLVDLPATAEPKDTATEKRLLVGERGELPSRAALANAEEEAWWKPHPGELTE